MAHNGRPYCFLISIACSEHFFSDRPHFWCINMYFLAGYIILDWTFSFTVLGFHSLWLAASRQSYCWSFLGNFSPCIPHSSLLLPGCFWDFSGFDFISSIILYWFYFFFNALALQHFLNLCCVPSLVLEYSAIILFFFYRILIFSSIRFLLYVLEIILCAVLCLLWSLLFLIFYLFIILCLTGVFSSNLSSSSLFYVCV